MAFLHLSRGLGISLEKAKQAQLRWCTVPKPESNGNTGLRYAEKPSLFLTSSQNIAKQSSPLQSGTGKTLDWENWPTIWERPEDIDTRGPPRKPDPYPPTHSLSCLHSCPHNILSPWIPTCQIVVLFKTHLTTTFSMKLSGNSPICKSSFLSLYNKILCSSIKRSHLSMALITVGQLAVTHKPAIHKRRKAIIYWLSTICQDTLFLPLE